MTITDDHLHQGMRRKLVTELERKGITNRSVLEAIGKLPRHAFIDDSAFLRFAYADIPFPIGHGQTISQPYTVAFQTALLDVHKGEKVLEIGTGCGYQTAVLCELGARVRSIERVKPLHQRTRDRLRAMGYKAELAFGDGFKGAQVFAPFDKILVTCGAPAIPSALVEQMKEGGRMVIPIGAGEVQTMVTIDKLPGGSLRQADHGAFRFVPMLKDRVEG